MKTESTAGPGSTVVDVDEAALLAAQKMLGTASPRDTVNESLREVVRRRMIADYLALKAAAVAETREARDQAWR